MKRALTILMLLAFAFLLWLSADVIGARGQEVGCQYPQFEQRELPIGSILLSRNADPSQNRTPTRWPNGANHDAIYIGSGYIVEAQDGYGVIVTSTTDYFARPYAQPVCIIPWNPTIGQRAALYAQARVGAPYGRYASIGPGIVRNILGIQRENCTSLVKDAYAYAVGYRLWGVRVPDDFMYRPDIFHGPYTLVPPQTQGGNQ